MRFGLGGFGRGLRWGAGRRRGDPVTTVIVLVFVLVAGGLERSLAHIDVQWFERMGVLAIVGLLLASVVVWLVLRVRRDRAAEAELIASSPTADVVAVRFAVEASAAPKLLRDLARSARKPPGERLAAVTQRLLEAQLDHRLVGLETTKPLPETAAAELFFFWSDGARGRYAKPEADAAKDGLVVVCLHVETSEEIPDLDPKDPKSALATLETLRDHPRTVRRVDLWASRAPLPEPRLRELDPVLVPARG